MTKDQYIQNIVELIIHDLDATYDRLEPRDYVDLELDKDTNLQVYSAFTEFLKNIKETDLK